MPKTKSRKKPVVSQSDLVRKFLRKNSKASVQEIVDAMEKAGTPVSKAITSQVKYCQKHTWSRKARKAREALAVIESSPIMDGQHRLTSVMKALVEDPGGATLSEMLKAKDFIAQMGGMDLARRALAALEEFDK